MLFQNFKKIGFFWLDALSFYKPLLRTAFNCLFLFWEPTTNEILCQENADPVINPTLNPRHPFLIPLLILEKRGGGNI